MFTAITRAFDSAFRVMLFCHDGKNLPNRIDSSFCLLIALTTLSHLGRDYLDPDGFNVYASLASSFIFISLLFVFLRLPAVVVMLSATLVTNLVQLMLYSRGFTGSWPAIVLTVWELAALLVVMTKLALNEMLERKTHK